MKWTEVVTSVVAVFALGLSIYNAIYQNRLNKPRVKVKIRLGFLVYGSRLGDETMVFLSASNTGRIPVTLSAQLFLLPNNKQLVFPIPLSNVKFPHELLPGKSCEIWEDAREIARSIKSSGLFGKVKLIGIYRDQTDISYRSKPFEFDTNEYFKNRIS